MVNFKPNKLTMALLSTGLLSLTSTTAMAADQAQADVEKDIEIIEVTGIRRSLAESQAIKMTESSIVEAVSAEDIGKLPDVSIAESIARLPGVTAQRLNGRANVISIRGLAPDFTTTTLNGREQVTTSDNRSVEFDQYPSELLNGVVVYKTPDASLLNQAIGGTIDMRTIRPLEHGEQTFSAGARYEENDLGALNSGSEDTGHRTSFSYIDQFFNDTVGVAIGIADMSSPNQEERWEAWGYDGGPVDGAVVLGGAKPFVRSAELNRTGVMAVFEYQPNDKLNTALDVYYSDFEEEQVLRGIEIPLSWGGAQLVDPVIVDGLVVSGTYDNVKALIRNDYWRRDSDIFAIGWNTSYQLTDKLSLEADVSYSKADRTDFSLESYSTNGRGDDLGVRDSIDFVMDGTTGAKFSPTLDYSDTDMFKLGAARSWGNGVDTPGDGQDGFINSPETEDELTAYRLTAEYEFDDGIISSVETGISYSDREKQKLDQGFYLTLNTYPDLMDVPGEFMKSPTDLGFIGIGDMISYDSYGLYKSGAYDEFEQRESHKATNTWTVKEEVLTLYAQANIDTEINHMGLTGNFGLQWVDTDQSSDGLGSIVTDQGFQTLPVSDSHQFDEFLPSLNLSLELTEEQVLRFAFARTLARARMDQMNASVGYNYDESKADNTDPSQSPWSGGGGNVALEPWIAKQYDLSYEYYLDDIGYISVAGFYKDLENYIFNESIAYDFTDVPVTGPEPALRTGFVSAPANGDGGEIHGIEATMSVSGDVVADFLSDFGLIVTGSITASEVKETPDSEAIDLPGLSKKVLNTTVYYENSGFEARVSSRYRSEFLGETTNFSFKRENIYVTQELIVDAQIAYNFNDSPWEDLYGLSVLFQVSNLTDEPFTTYQDSPAQPKQYQVYGRNFMVGMNYTF